MNKLGIKVGDVVAWGSKRNACEVKEVYSTFFYVNSSSSTISFTEPNLEIVKKGTKSLEAKYGIILINKEMWCWDDNIENASLLFVITKNSNGFFVSCDGNIWRNASLEKPNKTYKPNLVFLDDDYTKEEMINIINDLK
jgi:hypothetical protein